MYDLFAVESYSKARKDLPNAVQYTDFAESDSESQQSKAVSSKTVRRSSRLKRKISSDESDSGHETLLSNRPSPPRSLGLYYLLHLHRFDCIIGVANGFHLQFRLWFAES